jgi:hypothetical protein
MTSQDDDKVLVFDLIPNNHKRKNISSEEYGVKYTLEIRSIPSGEWKELATNVPGIRAMISLEVYVLHMTLWLNQIRVYVKKFMLRDEAVLLLV